MTTTDELVVYTVVMGEVTVPPPISNRHGLTQICFTDNPALEAENWDVRCIEPVFLTDLPRSSRAPKILPHRYLGTDFSRSLYIDSTVLLLDDPRLLWESLTGGGSSAVGLMKHSFHATLAEEFDTVFKLSYDTKERLNSQFLENLERNPHFLDLAPAWGGIIARQHNVPRVVEAMEGWWQMVCRFSRRDQLSLPLVLDGISELTTIVDFDNRKSDFHEWPVGPSWKSPKYTDGKDVDQVAALLQLNEAKMDLLRMREELNVLRHSLELSHESEHDKELELAEFKHQLEKVVNSRTWRLRAALRRYVK